MPAFAGSVRFAGGGLSVAGVVGGEPRQVLALLARMIAKGAVVDPDSHVGLEAGDA